MGALIVSKCNEMSANADVFNPRILTIRYRYNLFTTFCSF